MVQCMTVYHRGAGSNPVRPARLKGILQQDSKRLTHLYNKQKIVGSSPTVGAFWCPQGEKKL